MSDLSSAAWVTRFAPSPTGYLHLGSAYSALVSAASAGSAGRFLVRIEDIDPGRCRAEFADAMLEDLAWLGLRWETPVRHQSQHLADYQKALGRLQSMGLLYPCFCTRADIAAQSTTMGPDGPVYPGTCRRLRDCDREQRVRDGLPYALRLDMDAGLRRLDPTGAGLCWWDRIRGRVTARPDRFGDVVLARKDVPASYHIAVTVDDALQGITLVTRGMDLFEATDIHRLLQALLDLPVPQYHHHTLLVGPDGRRLAKSHRSTAIRALRADGKSAAEVRAMAGFPD